MVSKIVSSFLLLNVTKCCMCACDKICSAVRLSILLLVCCHGFDTSKRTWLKTDAVLNTVFKMALLSLMRDFIQTVIRISSFSSLYNLRYELCSHLLNNFLPFSLYGMVISVGRRWNKVFMHLHWSEICKGSQFSSLYNQHARFCCFGLTVLLLFLSFYIIAHRDKKPFFEEMVSNFEMCWVLLE